MKYCPNCHLSFNDDANVCTQCGTQLYVAVPQAQIAPTDHTADFQKEDISNNKVYAMAAYILGWIGILIAILAARDSAYAAFHVREALKIQVCTLLTTVLGIIPFIGWLAVIVFAVMALVINIICFFRVCAGQAKEAPIINSLGFLK